MSGPRIFDFKDYKAYLRAWADAQPKQGRGQRAVLARAARCQSAYVSQVLVGKAHFSQEQADGVSQTLGHGKEERRYFQLLVQHARAGTASLRDDLTEQLTQAREKQLVLKDRLKIQTLAAVDQERYFSSWHYAAIHVALTVPALRSRDAIARYLGLPRQKVAEVLETLLRMGLVREEKGGALAVGEVRIHLGEDTPMIARHHTNWRLQAIQAFDRATLRDQHYSSVVSISRDDAVVIKQELLDTIEKVKKVIRASKEEELYSLSLDFFGLAAGGQ